MRGGVKKSRTKKTVVWGYLQFWIGHEVHNNKETPQPKLT
jgi:hypothetical protein